MYYRDAVTNPDYQQNEVNFRHYYIVLPKKMEAIGAIYSYDGSTSQTSDASAASDKNWAQVRREAAKGTQRGGGEEEEEEETV